MTEPAPPAASRHRAVPSTRRFAKVLIAGTLVAITAAAYLEVGEFGFLNLDDDLYITANPLVRSGLSAATIAQSFTTIVAGNWHPLTTISHLLDVRLFGLAPGPHHVHNLLLHIANVVLLFFILARLSGALWRSAFVAAVFALHPLHVESVAWVSERKDLLSTLFGLAALSAYVGYARRPGLGRMAAVVGLAALGLMAKPMLVTLPCLLLLLDYWPLGRARACPPGSWRTSGRQAPWGALVAEKIPLFALSALFTAIALNTQSRHGAMQPLAGYSVAIRLGNAAISAVAYLGQAVWPAGLAVFYPHPGTRISPLLATLAASALAACSVLVLRACRKHPYLAVGWLWYLGMLVPVLGFIQLGAQSRADRYTYLPLTGVLVGATWGLGALVRGRWRLRALTAAAGAAAVTVLALACRAQAGFWRDDETLFTRALAVTSGNWLVHNNLGVALEAQGRVDEAARHYNEGIRLQPYFAPPYNNLGILAFNRGDYGEAARLYRVAMALMPAAADPPYNLGKVLERLGSLPEAEAAYRQALRLDTGMVDALLGLGRVLQRSGRFREALAAFQAVLRIAPGSTEALRWVAVLGRPAGGDNLGGWRPPSSR